MWPKGHVKRGKNTAYDEFWDAFNLSLDGCFIEVRIFSFMLSPNLAPFPPCLCGYEHSMIGKKWRSPSENDILPTALSATHKNLPHPPGDATFAYLFYMPSCLLMCSFCAVGVQEGGYWSVYCGFLLMLAWLVNGESLPLFLPPVFWLD